MILWGIGLGVTCLLMIVLMYMSERCTSCGKVLEYKGATRKCPSCGRYYG